MHGFMDGVGVIALSRWALREEDRVLDTFGRHLLVEYGGCDSDLLNDLEFIETLMKQAAISAKATIVTSTFHMFAPQGVSGVVVVQESHLSIHTWPERGYAAVDFYTCGDCMPELAHQTLLAGLRARAFEYMLVHRGDGSHGSCLHLDRHLRGVSDPMAQVCASGDALTANLGWGV